MKLLTRAAAGLAALFLRLSEWKAESVRTPRESVARPRPV